MKTSISKIIPAAALLALCFFGPSPLRSEPNGKSAIDSLTAIRDANKTTIDAQQKTLDLLDDMQKQAEELRINGKRT